MKQPVKSPRKLSGALRDATVAAVEAVERELIPKALGECGGNLSKAARRLGISYRAMHYKTERLGLLKYQQRINTLGA